MFVTSQGSSYARFRRALDSGNLTLATTAAAELPRIDLPDALAVLLLMAAQGDPRYDRAATRWLSRLALERPSIRLAHVDQGVDALRALADDPGQGRTPVGALCEQHGLPQALRVLAGGPPPRAGAEPPSRR